MAQAEDERQMYAAVIESQKGEAGTCVVDCAAGTLTLHTVIETSASYVITLSLLEALEPSVVVACSNSAQVARGFARALSASTTLADKVVLQPRSAFDDTRGAMMVRSLARPKDKARGRMLRAPFRARMGLEKRSVTCAHEWPRAQDSIDKPRHYLAFAAAAALLRLLADERGVVVRSHIVGAPFPACSLYHAPQLLPNMLAVSAGVPRQYVNVDPATVRNLELVAPLAGGATSACLLGLFKPKTKGGAVLLRATLLQPPADLVTINTRLDCLDELLTNEELYLSLSALLTQVPKAAERIVSNFVVAKKRTQGSEAQHVATCIVALLELRSLLRLVPTLGTALSSGSSALLRSMRDVCASPSLSFLDDKIGALLEDDPVAGKAPFVTKTNCVFAVKTGVCGFLDVSRRAFCETTEAIHALVTSYNDELAAAGSSLALKATFAPRRGFFLRAPAHEYDAAPADSKRVFIQVQKKGRQYHLSSAELNALNVRLLDAANDSTLLSQSALDSCAAIVRDHLPALTALSEALSLLDLLLSFATFVAGCGRRYVRPLFSTDGPIAVQNGRHPTLETLPHYAESPFVANHAFLSDTSSLVFVAGPNMAGKTTFLKQVGALCILAHAGCFVPADFASFRVLDRIVCVSMSQTDMLEENASTFLVECRELQHALASATRDSLVLVDELGRATSTTDAFALAFAACEQLLSAGALTLCATHNERLLDMAHLFPGVKCSHLRVCTSNNRLDFAYQLAEGAPSERHHYGCALARSSGLPASLVDKAEAIVATLERKSASAAVNVEGLDAAQGVYTIASRLMSLKHAVDGLDHDTLTDTLRRLRAAALQFAGGP